MRRFLLLLPNVAFDQVGAIAIPQAMRLLAPPPAHRAQSLLSCSLSPQSERGCEPRLVSSNRVSLVEKRKRHFETKETFTSSVVFYVHHVSDLLSSATCFFNVKVVFALFLFGNDFV